MLSRGFSTLIVAAFLGISVAPATAQDYPARPIKMIAPFPAGGLADVLARLIGAELSRTLDQQIIIENKTGAGGNIGADVVAKAEPDGYTLMMASAGILTANQFLYAQMPFDPEKAFVPISIIADMSMMVVVNPKVEANTLAEFVELARLIPGRLNFGSPGVGTTGHLGLALFMHAAGVKLTHVPYRGSAPVMTDLLAGQIDGAVDNPPTVLPHINAGKLRPLAVAGRERLALLPNVPTAAEAGVKNFEASSWFGIMAPAGTPKDVVARLHQHTAAALRRQPIAERILALGARPVGNAPDEFGRQVMAERVMWSDIIKTANIQAQ